MIGLGRVPPKFEIVLSSYFVSCYFFDIKSAYSHVCSANEWIRDLGVESRDTDELHSTIH